MGGPSGQKYVMPEGKRGDAWRMDPRNVGVVGYDPEWPAKDNPEAFDADRIEKLNDEVALTALAKAMIAAGFIGAINVKKATNKKGEPGVVAMVGRRRTIAARIACELLEKAGQPPLMIKCLPPDSGDPKELWGMVIGENQFREDDPPSVLAKKLEKYIRLCGETPQSVSQGTLNDAAAVFGVDHSTLRNWLGVGALAPEVRELVDAKAVPQNVALQLKDLPKDEQIAGAKDLAKRHAAGEKGLLKKARVQKQKAKGRAGEDEHEGLTSGQCARIFRLVQEDKVEDKEIALHEEVVKFLAAVVGKSGTDRVKGLNGYLARIAPKAKDKSDRAAE